MSVEHGTFLSCRIDALEARADITEIIHRYCRALDTRDDALLRSCFHPQSHHEIGDYSGPSSGFCTYAIDLLNKLVTTQHLLGNISITVKGNTADARSYFWAYHRVPPEGEISLSNAKHNEDVFIAGQYIDRFECLDGEWRIVERRHVSEWSLFQSGDDRGALAKKIEEWRGRQAAS